MIVYTEQQFRLSILEINEWLEIKMKSGIYTQMLCGQFLYDHFTY